MDTYAATCLQLRVIRTPTTKLVDTDASAESLYGVAVWGTIYHQSTLDKLVGLPFLDSA